MAGHSISFASQGCLTISITSTASIAFRRLLAAATHFSQRFAALVTVMALLLTVVAGVYFVRNFSMNMTTEEMLSDQLPFRQLARELDRELPERSGLVVVVEGRTPEQIGRASCRERV